MAQITWNNVAAPSLGESNSLFTQAIQSLKDAGTGLKDTAKDYQTVVRNKSHAILQDYINSAKTPEELQSEAFNTGFKNLQATLANEYDAVKVNDYRDSAVDKLTKRAGDAVALKRNEFGLTQDQLTAKKTENAAKLFALRNDPLAYKAEEQRQVAEGALDINAAQSIPLNVLNLANATIDNRVKRESADSVIASALLDPTVKQTGIDTALGNLEVARQNAQTNRLQAEAAAARAAEEKNKNKNAYIGTGFAAIDTAKKDVKEKIYGSGLNTDPEKSWKKWEEKTTAGLLNFDPAPNKVVELIDGHPELRELPDNLKILHAENALRYLRKSEVGSNPAWWFTSNSEETILKQGLEESFKNFNQQASTIENNATIPIYRKTVLEHAQKTGASGYAAAKDLGLDELTIYKSGIPSQLAAEAKIKYASSDKSIPESQFVENEINIATNPDYATSNAPLFPKPKQEAANVPAQSSLTVLNTLGTGSYEDKVAMLGSELKKTRDPIQIAFLNNELKKLEKDAPPVTANTSNSLQEQQQRMEAAALERLTAAALKQNGQPFVVPAITAKPEETKPRELTPAEKQQAERMNQAAIVRLAGAKLIAKQAEVQKQFPDTPLKQLAKAATPVPSPLVPVESQNAFKSRDNNLSINLSTGKSVPSKDPVPMPNVSWGKPAEVVTMNPMVAKLPQYKAVATFVGDGDTFKATSKQYATKGTKANGSVLCRVDSVDAPETPHPEYGKKGQPYGEEAGKKLQQMILNKEISIRIVKPANGDPNEVGHYGRDICQIEVEGANVSTELIRAGAAWLYREYNNYFTGLETVEANAKAEGRGLFSDPNAVYPPTAKHNGSLNLRYYNGRVMLSYSSFTFKKLISFLINL